MVKIDGNSGPNKVVLKSGFGGLEAVGSGKQQKSRTLVESRGAKKQNLEVESVVSQIVNLALKDTPHICGEVKRIVLDNLQRGVAILWSKLENLVPLDAMNTIFDALFTGGLLKQRT